METLQVTKTLRLSEVAVLPSTVSIEGHTYRVDLGPGVQPRYHTVTKDRTCTCSLGRDCPAIKVVARHLIDGGQRAPDPPTDYWFTVPDYCPVCGGPVQEDRHLNNRRHGRGWRCLMDSSHYWQLLTQRLMAAQQAAYVATPDLPGLPGVERQSPQEREAWLEAHKLTSPALR